LEGVRKPKAKGLERGKHRFSKFSIVVLVFIQRDLSIIEVMLYTFPRAQVGSIADNDAEEDAWKLVCLSDPGSDETVDAHMGCI